MLVILDGMGTLATATSLPAGGSGLLGVTSGLFILASGAPGMATYLSSGPGLTAGSPLYTSGAIRPDLQTTQTITLAGPAPTAGGQVLLISGLGYSAWNAGIVGSFVGTLYFEGSADYDANNPNAAHWYGTNGRLAGVTTTIAVTVTGTGSAQSVSYRGNVSAYRAWRVRAGTDFIGTATLSLNLCQATGAVFLNAALPAGTNAIGSVGLTTMPSDTQASGSLTAGSPFLQMTLAPGQSSWSGNVSGTWTGNIISEASVDGITWSTITIIQATTSTLSTQVLINGNFRGNCGGYRYVRLNFATPTSGTAVVALNASVAVPVPYLSTPLSAGTNVIGGVYPGVARNTAATSLADGAQAQVSLDSRGRVRTGNWNGMDPWQTYIRRYGSISSASTSDTLISNATAVGSANYSAQNADYVVGITPSKSTNNTTTTILNAGIDGASALTPGTYNLVSSCGTSAPATKLTANNGAVITSNSFNGTNNIVAGTYPLTLGPGTTGGTIKVTWNGVVSDNRAINTSVTVNGLAAGSLTVTLPGAAPGAPQTDNVTVTGTIKLQYNGGTVVDNIAPNTATQALLGAVGGLLQVSTSAYTGTFGTDVVTIAATNKTFYLKKVLIAFDNPPATDIHVTIAISGSKEMHYDYTASTSRVNGPNVILDTWEQGYPLAQGAYIQVFIRNSAGLSLIAFVRFEGYEELN